MRKINARIDFSLQFKNQFDATNSNLYFHKRIVKLIRMDLKVNKAEKTQELNNKSKPTIVLMTRWHSIFRCKSRLSKEIGALKAAKIQERLTDHTISVAKGIQKKGLANIKVAIDGIGINAAKKWGLLNNINSVSIQGPGNLGTKMKRAFLKARTEKSIFHQSPNSILLIGTDLPSISQCDLIQAMQILNHKELVLGPSHDGGYWLIGLSNNLLEPLCSWPFSGISWGTDQVLKKTICLAALNQIDYQLLQTQNDLDNISDILPWIDYKSFKLSASSYQL